MKGKFARTIAVIAAGSVLSLTGAGVATASAVDSAPGKGSGTASTTAAAAALIEGLRDQLVTAVDTADISAVTSTADQLEGALNQLLGGQRYSIPADAEALAAKASGQNAELRSALAEARTASIPDPLGMLNGLIQGLLDTLGSLIDSVLGAAPALPDPGLPVPELPEPGLPDPGVPDPGVPDPGAPPAPLP